MNSMSFDHMGNWIPFSGPFLHVTIILIIAWLLQRVSRRIIRALRTYMEHRAESVEDKQRVDTLARVIRYVTSVLITLVSGMLVLSELGISIAPILGAAGVVGIAIGFGAQSLIKDYFNGFFILLENQIRRGDVVEICDKGGLVEDVTLRYISLRDYDGNVHFIPNGLITTVTNRSRGFAFSVIDVGVAYHVNINEAFAAMRQVGEDMRADENFASKILDDLEIAGVENWADSAVILRCRFKVASLEQWSIRREFLRRAKELFDERGIDIPFPHITLELKRDKTGKLPTLPVKLDTERR